MSSIKDRIAERSASMLRREVVHLDDADVDVQARGMMFGEKERVGALAGDPEQGVVLIALTAEDPATGALIYNANDMADRERIKGWSPRDGNKFCEVAFRLSGVGEEGKASAGTRTSPSASSGSASGDAPSENSASA